MSRLYKSKYKKLIKGEEAEKMYADEWAAKVAPSIPLIGYYLLELRRTLLSNSSGKPSYYLIRHQYEPSDRFLLDIAALGLTYVTATKGEPVRTIMRLRYKYYYLRYYRYIHKPLGEWSRISKNGEKPIYALTTEILADDPEFGKNMLQFWLPSASE